jgi:hypothetical protein
MISPRPRTRRLRLVPLRFLRSHGPGDWLSDWARHHCGGSLGGRGPVAACTVTHEWPSPRAACLGWCPRVQGTVMEQGTHDQLLSSAHRCLGEHAHQVNIHNGIDHNQNCLRFTLRFYMFANPLLASTPIRTRAPAAARRRRGRGRRRARASGWVPPCRPRPPTPTRPSLTSPRSRTMAGWRRRRRNGRRRRRRRRSRDRRPATAGCGTLPRAATRKVRWLV